MTVFGGDTRISENDRLDDSLYLLNTSKISRCGEMSNF